MSDPAVRYIIGLKKRYPQKSYAQIIQMVLKAHPQKGRGIRSRARAAIRGQRGRAPPKVRKWLAFFGPFKIERIVVARKPIARVIDRALNFISGGELQANKDKFGYSDMFHLWLVIWLKDAATPFKVELNHVVEISKGDPTNADEMEVTGVSHLTLGELMLNADRKFGATLYDYNGTSTNCQQFVKRILEASGLLTSKLEAFIMQNAESILTGFTRKVAETVTDIAGRADILMNGEGKRRFIHI